MQAVEKTIAALEGAETALRAVERQAATTTALLGAADVRRRSDLQRGDLRRHAAPARRSPAASSASRPRFVSLEELAEPDRVLVAMRRSWSGSSRRSIRRCAASTSRAVAARLPRARRDLGRRQHVRQPGQSAAARARRRSRHAQRDQVPERAQRRDRRRAGRAGAADRADREGAAAVRRRARSVRRPTRSAAG